MGYGFPILVKKTQGMERVSVVGNEENGHMRIMLCGIGSADS
jgi:hypothetical protein